MKIFAVALVASVLVAVSLAAPTTSTGFLVELIETDEYTITIEDNENIERNPAATAYFQCVVNAIDSVVDKHGLSEEWTKHKIQIQPHLERLSRCGNSGSCTFGESAAISRILTTFLAKVRKEKPAAYTEIQETIRRRCLSPSLNVPAIDVEETPLNSTVDYVEILSCAIDVSRNVTQEFNLTEIWEAFEPELVSHLANFTECPSLGDADAVQACYDAELQATNVTFRTFLGLVEDRNEEAAAKIVLLYWTVCRNQPAPTLTPTPVQTPTEPSARSESESDKHSPVNGTDVLILTCAIEAGKNVTEEYELAEVWEIFEPVLQGHLENITNCASLGDEEAVQACLVNERLALHVTIREFLAALKEVNEEAEAKFVLLWRTVCLNQAPPTPTLTPVPTPTEPTSTLTTDGPARSNNNNNTVDYIALLECAIDAGQNVTAEYELTTIWEIYEPTLTGHLANLTDCSAAGDEDAAAACLTAELVAANLTYTEFVLSVREFSEEAAEKIILIVRTVCRGNVPTEEATTPNPTEEPKFRFDEDKNESEEEFDLAENTPSNETVDYVGILECATRTAENISNEYDLLEDFELFNPQFALHLAALEKCSEGEDDAAIQACVELEAQAATKTFEKFLEVIREKNEAAAEAFIEQYTTVCLSETTPSEPTPIEPSVDVL